MSKQDTIQQLIWGTVLVLLALVTGASINANIFKKWPN